VVINIYLPPIPYEIKTEADYHIGVEHAAIYAIEKNISLNRVISDFDSTKESEKKRLLAMNVPLDVHPSIKDDTDSMLAVKEALKLNPERIYLYTGIGTRVDHLYANLMLLEKGPITLLNDTTKAYVLKPGSHPIESSLKYVSFYALKPVKNLTLKGFKYPLNNYMLDCGDPRCISNEASGEVFFETGVLLVIESKD
jgi:thiamine pyrophosphokinase